MPKVRCSMVISPNGFIARLDGDEEWINGVNWTDFLKDAKACNNIIVGRDTFEIVMRMYKDYNFDSVDCDHKVIVTNNKTFKAPAGYTIVSSPKEAIDYLSQKGVKEILLSGGGKLNASFAEAGLIDELEFILEPYVISQGRPVLAAGDYELALEFIKNENLSNGRMRVLYKVKK